MAGKKTNKPLVYVIDKNNEIRSAHAVIRDMKRCDIVVLLGNEKTPQMEKEEKLARHLKKAIFYRPSINTMRRLMEVGVFPEYQRKFRLNNL